MEELQREPKKEIKKPLIFEESKASADWSEECLDRAMGCIVGAFCGDAIGAPLEFRVDKSTEELIDKAMKMKLKGTHRILPGQITDDSELALWQLHGLLEVLFNVHIVS
jgi:ADP-ribosylglycohydrolase